MQLDRFIQLNTPYSRSRVKRLLAEGRVRVANEVVFDGRLSVDRFVRIELDDQVLQDCQGYYLMLHKPSGVVSATTHPEHQTVIDLLPPALRPGLHLAGRLDLKTTGLMLLTNDGHWSRRITQPTSKIAKVYRVTTQDEVAANTAEVFRQGIYFGYEGMTTQPAELERIDSHHSRLTLYEGRYHQVKRMFGYFDNEVIELHREKVGDLSLDSDLLPGDFRPLTAAEIALF